MVLDKRAWWLKVACGAGLLVNLFITYLALPGSAPLALPGQILVVVGGPCTLYHAYLLGAASKAGREPDRLVTRGGLFPWIRHPMYVGDALLYLGLSLLAPSVVSGALLTFGWLGLALQARAEDKFLAARFGAEFEQWRHGPH